MIFTFSSISYNLLCGFTLIGCSGTFKNQSMTDKLWGTNSDGQLSMSESGSESNSTSRSSSLRLRQGWESDRRFLLNLSGKGDDNL